MLVLSRTKGEKIRIGTDIIVEVHHIGQHSVKLAITAPQSVRVMRTEIEGEPAFKSAWAAQCPPGDDPQAWALDRGDIREDST